MKKNIACILLAFVALIANMSLLAQSDPSAAVKEPGGPETAPSVNVILPPAAAKPAEPTPAASAESPTVANKPVFYDEEGVRNLVSKFTDLWNQHDPRGLTELWDENGDYISVSGKLATNLNETDIIFYEEQRGRYAKSQLETNIQNIRFFSPILALVDLDMNITGAISFEGREKAPQNVHMVLVVARKNENESNWKIIVGRSFFFIQPVTRVSP